MGLDLPGNGSTETTYDEGDRNLSAVNLLSAEVSESEKTRHLTVKILIKR